MLALCVFLLCGGQVHDFLPRLLCGVLCGVCNHVPCVDPVQMPLLGAVLRDRHRPHSLLAVNNLFEEAADERERERESTPFYYNDQEDRCLLAMQIRA